MTPEIEKSEGDQSIESLLHWPGTPTLQELEYANRLDREQASGRMSAPANAEGRQAADDLFNLRILDNLTHRFSKWAAQAYAERISLIVPPHEKEKTIDAMLKVICSADDENVLGAMIAVNNEAGDPEALSYTFTLLQRNPRWMGVNRLLEKVSGSTAVVLESPKVKDRIAAISAMPQKYWAERNSKEPFSEGQEAKTLTQILNYHGATSVEWLRQWDP